ncbi:4-(cytidine 5'-diphospho)-2-C-methyl-D-erythritol kinase [Nocardioides bizhenqiangii]|uniref:4-diphosphocytidyl-2-C-methyl-D-erythritol kinase n=1 Tax=Nocardioides bizhenqiangii TaxID=3095076 RepID=A0ABZ0ZTG2_9ACTN|nr:MULTISPECIES: 4-(cytidine 5'-diphospho)-2-C-methyl-D-erythritol kinase [unclassified Nocardioides]MDZ5622128.1 4-(cytidine 5'-diphospho)-2-C-methyl-D-erythritol kinase [Nocardioides sp. HM23]WQQ27201.1 4-(cytidine 5'-diphospho)-2-C-methyl-D-erythritol kinase [Nocardioides sp. HM61]
MSAALLPDPISVTVRAPAKINIYLGVGKVRPDGFHPLETVYQAVSLYDDVTVTDAEEWSVSTIADGVHVEVREVPDDDSNIAIRAGKALVAHHRLDDRAAAIQINKGIPVAGGMAGGSADAAATLVALDRLWSLGTADEELLAIGAELGSDVPFALVGGTATGTGRGEVVTPVEDNGSWWWVVVFSDDGLSTPSVYGAYDLLEGGDHDYRIRPQMLEALRAPANGEHLQVFLYNDLEDAAFYLRPDLQAVAEAALECQASYALLSGSGPTMLALAADADSARAIAGRLAERGYDRTAVVHGPVAGAHVVAYG